VEARAGKARDSIRVFISFGTRAKELLSHAVNARGENGMGNVVSSPLFKFVVLGTFVGLFASSLGCKKLVDKVLHVDGGATPTSSPEAKSRESSTTSAPEAKSKDPDEPNSPEAKSSTVGLMDPDEQLAKKIEPYIECLNSLSSSTRDAEKSYLHYIPKTGPTGRESPSIYKLPKDAAAKCSTSLAEAKTMQPSAPALEQAGEAFAKATTQLDPLLMQLEQYFENKDYLDDHWAKGKQLHPQVMAAFKDFNPADDDLRNVLDGITKPLSQRELAKIEREEGKKIRYHRKHVLNTARELIEVSNPDGGEVNSTLYNAAMTEFDKALEDLTAYGSSHKSDIKDEIRYDSFVKAANDYRKVQKDLWRCLRNAPAKVKLSNDKINVKKLSCPDDNIIDRVADRPIEKYNDFIRWPNTQEF